MGALILHISALLLLFQIPKGSRRAWIAQTIISNIENAVSRFTGRDQGWEENFGLRDMLLAI